MPAVKLRIVRKFIYYIYCSVGSSDAVNTVLSSIHKTLVTITLQGTGC